MYLPIPTTPAKCIPKMKSEGKPQDQAVAICLDKQKSGQKMAQITTTGNLLAAKMSARILTAQLSFKKKRE